MNKKPKEPKSPAKSAPKRKVVIEDLKATEAGSVKGGGGYDMKLNKKV